MKWAVGDDRLGVAGIVVARWLPWPSRIAPAEAGYGGPF
jgi:hypothetical protein